MAETIKVLGQVISTAGTDVNLYTVPAARSAVVSTIMVCNRANTDLTFRMAVRPAGAAIGNVHYLYYDSRLASKATLAVTIGMTLATTDVITVNGSGAGLTFTAFGTEVS